MKLTLRGSNSRVSHSELKYATKFMSSLIMSPNLIKRLSITIQMSNKDPTIHALCEWMDDNYSPREFRILLNGTINRKQQLLALAHELVHVKQYAKNELRDTLRGPTNVRWKKEYVDDTRIHYYDLPWEIEAHGRETGMYLRYLDHTKKMGLEF
jgi:hypothetical protein